MSAITMLRNLPGTIFGRTVPLSQRIFSNYILRRLVKAVITIWLVITATFFIIRLMPGSPVEIYIQEQMSLYGMSYDDARAQASAMFGIGLDRPVIFQYFDYMGNLLRGDMGTSYKY